MENTKSIFKAMNTVIDSSFECIAMRADPPQQMKFPTDAPSLIRKRNSAWKQWEIIRNSVFRVLMNRLQRQIQTCIHNEAEKFLPYPGKLCWCL
jgi:hypothetical protein